MSQGGSPGFFKSLPTHNRTVRQAVSHIYLKKVYLIDIGFSITTITSQQLKFNNTFDEKNTVFCS